MTDRTPQRPEELLVRAADAGATYLSWTWLTEPYTPHARKLDPAALGAALDLLDAALPVPRNGESGDDAVIRVLSTGALADLASERALSRALADAVLPEQMRHQLAERITAGRAVRVRVTPSPRLARVPWEILVLDDTDRRLVEVAEIRYDPPATVHARRSRPPTPWHHVRDRPVLFVVDPKQPAGAGAQVLAERDRQAFSGRLEQLQDNDNALYDDEEPHAPVAGQVTRQQLSTALAVPRSRLLYFGHVDSVPEQPGSASLMLTDTVDSSWGMISPTNGGGAAQRPFSALDLLLGTTLSGDENLTSTHLVPAGVPGSELWPMPPRVAVIACEGGADYRAAETFGLVIAMLDAGAELVTTTRWIMPTDTAFRRILGTQDVRPTVDLALRVDQAHSGDDPVGELRRWQCEQLEHWRAGAGLAHSPLVWAAMSHTVAPAR